MITGKNEARILTKDVNKCNSNKKCNNDKRLCECKKHWICDDQRFEICEN